MIFSLGLPETLNRKKEIPFRLSIRIAISNV